jgi:hypothetical protein
MKKLLLGLLTLASLSVLAQDTEKKLSVKPYGFVGFDAFVDTRTSATARNGHVYLYPTATDSKQSKFDFGASITRLGVSISGPDAFGATTTAKVEGDFLGSSGNGKDQAPRLRHAFINLSWEKSSVLVGKSWHPFFVTENFPATVNFVVGAPIHPLSRAPQIKYSYKVMDDLSVSVIALTQSDFQNSGSVEQVENSGTPEVNVQLKYGSPKKFFAATTFGVKQQAPVVDKSTTSIQANLSLRYTLPSVTLKAEGVYGGNMTNHVMIGGLANKVAIDGSAIKDEFLPIYTSSVWGDIHTNGKKVQFGVFGGITNNLGTKEESGFYQEDTDNDGKLDIDNTSYTRGSTIASVTAIAPRVTFISGRVKVGLELMNTIASYGAKLDEKSKPIDTKNYANNRITLGVRYNF